MPEDDAADPPRRRSRASSSPRTYRPQPDVDELLDEVARKSGKSASEITNRAVRAWCRSYLGKR